MVKAVYFGPSFSEKLTQFCNKGTSTGLILGSVVDERAFGVCCVETPAEVEVEENNSELVKKDVAVDVTWMLEHATQVCKLLPGGITILGFFIFHKEDVLSKYDGKVRKLISGVTNLDANVPSDQLIFVSNNVAKVLDSKTSSYKNLDLKVQEKEVEFVRLDSNLILDIPLAKTKVDELSNDLEIAVARMEENLKHSIFIFGNKVLGDKDVLGKTFDYDKKKSKGKNKNETDVDGDVEVQTVLNVELLMTDNLCPESVSLQQSVIRMKVAGKLSSRVYLAPGASVENAKQQIVADIIRSLKTRFSMHCDTIQNNKENTDEVEEKRLVHEPPRRVFVSIEPSELGLSVSDYLYPGEGSEDCINNVKELFGWEISEDNIEDDLEIVATPRDTRGPPPPNSHQIKNTRRKVPFAAVASLGMAAIAVGLAYFSMGE